MIGTGSRDLPKIDDTLLVNLSRLVGQLTTELQRLSPAEYDMLGEDLERLSNILRVTKSRQARELRSPGSVQVKYVRKCGPYGYLVMSSPGSKPKWKYLGKDTEGYGIGYYPPGTPMKFKKRTGYEFVGDWSGKRVHDDSEGTE